MKPSKFLIISLILLAALLLVTGSAAARLTTGSTALVNSVFASGNAGAPMASTNFQAQAVVGQAALPNNAVEVASLHYEHQPGFLPGPTALYSRLYLPLVIR